FQKPLLTLFFWSPDLTIQGTAKKVRWLIRGEMRQEPLIKLFKKKSFLTAYLVDQSGNLLVHTDPAFVMRAYNFSNYPIVQKIREGKINNQQMEFEDDQGISYLAAYKTLGIGQTAVVAQVEREQALSAVNRVQYRALLVTGIVVCLEQS